MSETIYTVGGTVQAGSGFYIPRRADEELLKLCREGSFAYILSPRQLGKSSLMVHTSERLSEEGVQSVIIDLTQIGVQVTAEEWYLGLLTLIEDQLMLETDTVQWWQARKHLGVTQRLTLFFSEVLLKEIPFRIVIFVDEIDTTLGLSFTDDFYAAIRYFYNARSHTNDFQRLSFVLIGVATPGDLIRDPQRTPFNIGQRVELTDWTFEEALPLAAGLGLSDDKAKECLSWVLKWTGGHPYLTQRLCRAMIEQRQQTWTEADVDRLVSSTFFGERSEQDNNLQFVRDMLTKRAPNLTVVLATYRDIRKAQKPIYDEEQSLIKSHLKLSGVVHREQNTLRIRNPIYAEVFDSRWVKEHLPINWTKRLQRAAIALVATLLVISAPLALYAMNRARAAERQRSRADENAQKVQNALTELQVALAEAQTERQRAIEQQHLAEEQKKEAEQLKKVAEQRSQEAEQLRNIAEQRSQEALKQRSEAERLRQFAEQERTKAVQARQIAEQRGEEIEQQGKGNLAELLRIRGKYEEAEPLYKQYLEYLQRKSSGQDDPNVILALSGMAELYRSLSEFEKAKELYSQILASTKKTFGANHQNVAKVLNNMAELYRSEKRYDEAEQLYKQSIEITEKTLGKNSPELASLLESYAVFLRELNREAEATRVESLYRTARAVTGEFIGKVVDARTGRPINGAIIKIINKNSGVPTATRTDSEGNFAKDMLESGAYTIRVFAPGYKTFEIVQRLFVTKSNTVVPSPITLEPIDNSSTTRQP